MLIKQKIPYIILLFLLVIAFFLYLPGLKGGFLFDDFHNLGEMARYGDLSIWNNAKDFIFGGIAGPTGRPIALASFWLQWESWPKNAYAFKMVNLFIHLTCGLLLFIASKLLLKSYGYKKEKTIYVALISSSIWLLHPMFISTTLYVIQRMAQLPMLFGLLGIIGYLKGRSYLSIYPLKGYTIMTLSIGIATVLSTFSKENGALLPLLIGVIEFCNPIKKNKPIWCWRAIFLWLPIFVIFILFYKEINFSNNPWPSRPFNQIERLWSESRILCDYLYQLFFPKIEGYGLFQDGYEISKGWFSPRTTLISFGFLSLLVIVSIIFRKKYPLFTLSVFFFFAAHLMESSVWGLELYFEHRNYIAAMFLFLPISAGLYNLGKKNNAKLAIILTIFILCCLAWLTWQRSNLWADTNKLQIFWAQKNPESPRAQVYLAQQLMILSRETEANALIEQTKKIRPDSSLLSIRLIRQKIDSEKLTMPDLIQLKSELKVQRIDGQSITDLRLLIAQFKADLELSKLYSLFMIEALDDIYNVNGSLKSIDPSLSLKYFLQGQLYLGLENPQQAYDKFYQSLYAYNDTEAGLGMVIELANAGYLKRALNLLEQVEIQYKKQPLKENLRMKGFYDQKIKELYFSINKDLQTVLMQSVKSNEN